MAAPVSIFSNRNAGRSNTATMSASTPAKLTLSTRSLRFVATSPRNGEVSTGAYSPSPISPGTSSHPSRPNWKNDMSFSTSGPALSGSIPNHAANAKLHKRAPSSSSLSGATSPPTHGMSHFSTPFATLDDTIPDVATSPAPSSAVPKIKPYLRKMSVSKEDKGVIDLSKSRNDTDQLSSLGVQEFGSTKSAVDVSFAHSRRGVQHGRTTSTGSQVSTGSGRTGPTQPFTHPMAKTPRPYTPPTGISYASSLNDEADEGEDTIEDRFRLASGFKTRRSTSMSSTPAITPIPLSRTTSELKLVSRLTSTSQSNLSVVSNQSEENSTRSRKSRPRRNTDLSHEYVLTPSSRTSFDKAFAFVPRRSDTTDTQSRDERILAARRKFEEKEANKDRKQEKVAYKRRESEAKQQERQRKKSDAPTLSQVGADGAVVKQARKKASNIAVTDGAGNKKSGSRKNDFRAKSYEDYRPANVATLPRHGTRPGESDKQQRGEKLPRFESAPRTTKNTDGTWMRFSTWLQTRMLSCGRRG